MPSTDDAVELASRASLPPRELLTLLSVYLSAIIHDFDHRGVNNQFLVRAADPLAILYNDVSPMENHHVAAAFTLLREQQYNFLERASVKVNQMSQLSAFLETTYAMALFCPFHAHHAPCNSAIIHHNAANQPQQPHVMHVPAPMENAPALCPHTGA